MAMSMSCRSCQVIFCSWVDFIGFEGLACENNIDDCFNVMCPHGKVCFDLIGTYECRCPAGYTGDQCNINIDECISSPCQNNGTCIDDVAGYNCLCQPGYTGMHFYSAV